MLRQMRMVAGCHRNLVGAILVLSAACGSKATGSGHLGLPESLIRWLRRAAASYQKRSGGGAPHPK